MMTFAQENYFHLVWIALAVIFLFLAVNRIRNKRIAILFSESIHQIVCPIRKKIRFTKQFLLVLATLFLVIAIMRPQWGYETRNISRHGSDIYILVDTSLSMNAQDISPSRIERAKRELSDLVKILKGDRVGLIPFAGTSYVACPLTLDYGAFQLFVDQIDTSLIPVQGTNILKALQMAEKSFGEGDANSKAIILLTDGEITEGDTEDILNTAKDTGIKIYVIGIGKPEGAPIPMSADQGGFKKDSSDRVIISKLEEEGLKKLAVSTGGSYVRSVTGDLDLDQIYLSGIKKTIGTKELKQGEEQIPIERYQYPLLLSILCLVIEKLLKETTEKV